MSLLSWSLTRSPVRFRQNDKACVLETGVLDLCPYHWFLKTYEVWMVKIKNLSTAECHFYLCRSFPLIHHKSMREAHPNHQITT